MVPDTIYSPETPSLNTYPVATMEDGNATTENTYYANLDATRDAKPSGFDSEWDNQNVSRLTSSDASRQTGPSITLKVNSGDKLNLSVKSFYQSNGADYGRNALGTTALGQLVSALLSPMALTGSSLGVATDLINNSAFGNSSNFQNMIGTLPDNNYNNPADNTPKAYLVWMLFDSEFNLVKTGNSSGMQQVPTGADQLNTMAQNDITMDKSGFFYAYIVNESPMNVYFDDFQVSTTSGQVLEENHYYPFGMLNAQLSAPGITDPINNYKYNGKELQNELSLEWLDYGARFYDPQIGRWHRPDLMSEYFNDQSPYNYVANNPVSFIDPDGNFKTRNDAENYQDIHGLQGEILRDIWGNYFISERSDYTGEGVGVAVTRTFGPSGHKNGMGPYGGPLPNALPHGFGGGRGDASGQRLINKNGIELSRIGLTITTGTDSYGVAFNKAKVLSKILTNKKLDSKAFKYLTGSGTVIGAIAGGVPAVIDMVNNGLNWRNGTSFGLAILGLASEFTGLGEAWDGSVGLLIAAGSLSYDVWDATH